jgi:hypothetical protein
MNKYLPIGSVVLLKNAEKKLMIYGRNQKDTGNDKMGDYIGCLYPEGYIDLEHTYIFNHDQIQRVFFIGFQDAEELELNEYLLKVTSL